MAFPILPAADGFGFSVSSLAKDKQRAEEFALSKARLLDPLDYKAVFAFRTQLETIVPILDLRVFGSRSRGDAREDSDLDVFIKVAEIDRSLREKIYDIAWEVGFEYDRLISTFVVTERQIKEEAVGASPLLAKVLREGIVV